MKTITKLLLVGLIALGMTACSNEDEVKLEGKAESTVSIKVVPSSNGPTVRSVGDLSAEDADGVLAAESAIKTLEVYLFYGDTPNGYGIATAEETESVTEVKEIPTTVGSKIIYVVANANIGRVLSKQALLNATKNLPVVIAEGLPMTGESAEVTLVAGLNQYGYAENSEAKNFAVGAPLKIHRVNARVAIIGATLDLTNTPQEQKNFFDALSDVEVAMFNVPKESKLFGETLVTETPTYLFGEAWPTTASSYTVGALETTFKDSVAFPIVNTTAPYYYVNENTSEEANEQMMIVLRAKPTKKIADVNTPVVAEGLYTDADGYTYYPVWVNANKDDYTYSGDNTGDSKIRRNTQYNISLTIKGIGNPTIDPVEDAFLDVLVSVEDWKVVDQDVVWN